MFKEHFTNSEILLISRFHGLINFSVVIYTKEVCGCVDCRCDPGWCEEWLTGPPALTELLQELSAEGSSSISAPRWDVSTHSLREPESDQF